MLNEKEIQEIGLFKFSLIAPVVNDTYIAYSKEQFYREVASKTHKHPSGKEVKYSNGTIKRWHMQYKKNGFDGLLPMKRSDAGIPRSFSEKVMNEIYEIKTKFPHITTKMVRRKLIEDGFIKASEVSLSSMYRYIKANNLKRNQLEPIERRAYEMENVNDCWLADTSHLLRLKINGKSKKTYLIAIIDDKSRLLVHSEIFFNDNAVNFQIVLKKAIKKYGIPKKLLVDNGGPYKNKQLSMITASLGINLIHTRPYSGASKAKIERVFRTVKDNYVNCTDWNIFKSLENLNQQFTIYLNTEYQNKIHSGIKTTPRERYKDDMALIKYKPTEEIEKSFLHRITRKVRKDGTIIIQTELYEVSQKYINQTINLRYAADDTSELYIIDQNNKIIETIYKLDKVANSKIKRKGIDYSKIGGNRNV
jgi:transposase InsO family protein